MALMGKPILNAAGELLFLEYLWIGESLAGNIPKKPSRHTAMQAALRDAAGRLSDSWSVKLHEGLSRCGRAGEAVPCPRRAVPCRAMGAAATSRDRKALCKKSSVLNKMTTEL